MTEIFVAALAGSFTGCVLVGATVLFIVESHRRSSLQKQRMMYEEALRESDRMTQRYRETMHEAVDKLAATQKEAAQRINTAIDRASRTLPDSGEIN